MIWDAAYELLAWENRHTLSALRKRAYLIVGSFSKSFYLGVRTGYALSDDGAMMQALADRINEASSCSPIFVQYALAKVYKRIKALAEERKNIFRRRGEKAKELLENEGIALPKPHAAFYLFLQLHLRVNWEKLLEEEGVAVVPGEAFGESYANFVRISLAEKEEKLRSWWKGSRDTWRN